MALLGEKELTSLIPGIKALEKQFGDKVLTPVDFALEVNGKRKEIPISKLPTENLLWISEQKLLKATLKSSPMLSRS